MNIKQLERAGINAVKELRKSKFEMGLPFMINSKTLPTDQCYLEYPNGLIVRVTLCRKRMDFKIIFELSSEESNILRSKLGLV